MFFFDLLERNSQTQNFYNTTLSFCVRSSALSPNFNSAVIVNNINFNSSLLKFLNTAKKPQLTKMKMHSAPSFSLGTIRICSRYGVYVNIDIADGKTNIGKMNVFPEYTTLTEEQVRSAVEEVLKDTDLTEDNLHTKIQSALKSIN